MNAFENPCPGQANGLSAYYFAQAVQMLIATHCTLGSPDDYPEDSARALNSSAAFDFIIVGGVQRSRNPTTGIIPGSSGSVIANRLSENPKWKILLLESGSSPTFESDIPGFALSLNGRQLDWKFSSSSTNTSCLGMENETCPLFQGRVLGGTSTINKMHYFRGFPGDYNEWEQSGNAGWNFESVLPYFKKSQKIDDSFKIVSDSDYDELFGEAKEAAGNDVKLNELSKIAAGKYHSKTGLLSVNHFSYDFYLSEVKKAIFSAAEQLGVPQIGDVNRQTRGFVRALGTIHEGSRGNIARAFLKPVKGRKNLFVLKNATVQQITLRGKTATGVKFIYKNEMKTATAAKEVILSAGAVNSPRLLLLSGIGPKEQLQKAGIALQHDLKGVGDNLQTHATFFGLPVALKKMTKSISHLQKIDAMYSFISRGTGHFGGVGMNDVVGFTVLNNKAVQFLHYLNHARDYYNFNELLISLRVIDSIRDQYSKAYADSAVLLICPTLLQPKSRGRIEVVSRNFEIPPKIYANILSDYDDVNTLIEGIKFGLNMTQAGAFQDLEPELVHLEIESCRSLVRDSDEFWECLIRHLTTSTHDAAGTCKMGPSEDSSAVVDSNLKLHGIKGLRVADSSVMPTIIKGSVSVASVMIGEKVSDLIKKEWKARKHEEL